MRKIKYIFLIFVILVFGNTIISCSADYDTTSNSSIEIQQNVPIWAYIEIQYDKDDWKKYSSFSIYVDDEKIGKVKVNEHKYFDLYMLTGEHKIYIERNSLSSSKKSPEETFVVSSEHRYFAYKITEKSFINPSLEEIETDDTISEKRQKQNIDKPKETTALITTEIGDNNIEDTYREVLNACNQEDSENNFTYREYYITDINNDGIPELIIHIGRNIKDAEYIIYTYKDNKVYECGVSGGNLSIEDEDEEKLERLSKESQAIVTKGDDCIYISFCYAGYQHTSAIKLNDDLLLEVSNYYDSGSEKLSDYNIPGETLKSSDFLDTNLLNNYFSIDSEQTTAEITTKQTTAASKETTVTTSKITTAKPIDSTYDIIFEADELLEEAGLSLSGHEAVAVLSNLTCSNGTATIETEKIHTYDALVRVKVTGAKAGDVTLGGTITTYGLDMNQGELVSYPVNSGVFLFSQTIKDNSGSSSVKTTTAKKVPSISGSITKQPALQGYDIYISVSGNYDYYNYNYYEESIDGSSSLISSGRESNSSIKVSSFSGGVSSVYADVTPYNNDGTSGKTINASLDISSSSSSSNKATAYSCSKSGQINCHEGTVAGFTTDYVVNGGAVGKVRTSLGDKWHITAKNVCYNYDITWYELWDSDDGDYYGWVDSSYIDFY